MLVYAQLLCLGLEGEDCTTVVVAKDGDTCQGIADTAGIPVDTLLANNPNVQSNCDNIPQGIVSHLSHV
jgi:LysM repeat protein